MSDNPKELDLDKVQAEEPTTEPSDEPTSKEEQEAIEGDHRRKDNEKNHLHKVFIVLLWIGAGIAVAVLVVRVAHLICGPSILWLDDEQIANIDRVMFSGAMGGFLGKYLNRLVP